MRFWASVVAAAFCVLSATSAHATNQLKLFDVCLRSENNIDAMTEKLSRYGWSDSSETAEALTHGLKWIGTTQYFTTDSGGETVEAILSLKERTSAGLLRKRDIPQSKSRFLLRRDDVLHVMWRKPTPLETEIECHAALSGATALALRVHSEDAESAFEQFPAQNVMGGQVHITLLNAEKLSPHTPPVAVVRTYISSHSK